MTTADINRMGQAGTEAVKKLRLEKFRRGFPFMINSKELPKRQSYLEYPDGTINLVTLSESGTEFIIIKALSKIERIKLREKFNLAEYA